MTVHEILVPKLGLDTMDCDIKGWLVKIGDRVELGTPLLEVETEKAFVDFVHKCLASLGIKKENIFFSESKETI